ncbi:MAG: response regulator [Bdellovibrio sp.]|nr:response regulator [Bdellovibrio sp.]
MQKNRTLNVLVDKDNQINQMIIKNIFEKLGHDASVVENGFEVLKELNSASKPFDLIFLDGQMPEMDGYEATRKIRARTDRCKVAPIVAMTASALPGEK